MSPFAGYFWNLVSTATGLGLMVGALGGIAFGLLGRRRLLGLLATCVAFAVATAVSEGFRFLFRFGGYGVPVVLFGYLGFVVPAHILEARAGWRPVWGTLTGIGVVAVLTLAIRFVGPHGEWVPLWKTCALDVGLVLLWIRERKAQRLSEPR
jgi:hypothetical protein